MDRMWVVSIGAQEEEINKYCFSLCGMILIGAFDLKGMGFFAPCAQEKCAYEADTLDLGEWDVPIEGPTDLVARKLTEVSDDHT